MSYDKVSPVVGTRGDDSVYPQLEVGASPSNEQEDSGNSSSTEQVGGMMDEELPMTAKSSKITESRSGGRFDYSQSRWRDLPFLIAFVAHIIVMIIVAATSKKPNLGGDIDSGEEGSPNGIITTDVGRAIALLTLVTFIGGLFAGGWLYVMKRYSAGIITTSLVIMIASYGLGAVANFFVGSFFMAIMFVVLAGLTIFYYFMVRSRIPFAAATLEVASEVVQTYPAMSYVSFIMALIQLFWTCFWGATFMTVFVSSNSGGQVASFLMLISFYWTSHVIKNIVHVTCSGVAATWYFFAVPQNPTFGALKRATTTSLGSICFGSLLIAVLDAIRFVVRSQRDRNNAFCQCIMECILNCVRQILDYFNLYAFTQVAIYGKSFLVAAKDTWQLAKSKGFDAVINDDLTGFVLMLGCFIGALVCGVIGGLAAKITASLTEVYVLLGILSFLIGFIIVSIVLTTVRSSIATLFVCWIEDPVSLATTHPESFKKFGDALRTRFNNDFCGNDEL